MGATPESIPYEEFLELRREVSEIQCSLRLVLRLLSGISGFPEDQIEPELIKELSKKNNAKVVNNVVPKTEPSIECIDISDNDHTKDHFVMGPNKPMREIFIEFPPKPCGPTRELSAKRKSHGEEVKGKKPVIVPVDIATLLPTRPSVLKAPVPRLSDASKSAKINTLPGRRLSNEVTVPAERIKPETPEFVVLKPNLVVTGLVTVTDPTPAPPGEPGSVPRVRKKRILANTRERAHTTDNNWVINDSEETDSESGYRNEPELITLDDQPEMPSIKNTIVINFRDKIQNKIAAATSRLLPNRQLSNLKPSPNAI